MKEAPSIGDIANDFVIKTEDEWVNEQWETVDQLQRRAKGSHTLVAQHEFESARDRLSSELERLSYVVPNPEEK